MRISTALWAASLALVSFDGQGLTTAEAAPAPFGARTPKRPRYILPRQIRRRQVEQSINETSPGPSQSQPRISEEGQSSPDVSVEVVVSTAVVVPVPVSEGASQSSDPPIIVPVALPPDEGSPSQSAASVDLVTSTAQVIPIPASAAPAAPLGEQQQSQASNSNRPEPDSENPPQSSPADAAPSVGIPPVIVLPTPSLNLDEPLSLPSASEQSLPSDAVPKPAVPKPAVSENKPEDVPAGGSVSTGGIPDVVVLPSLAASDGGIPPVVVLPTPGPEEETENGSGNGIPPIVDLPTPSSGGLIPPIVVLPTLSSEGMIPPIVVLPTSVPEQEEPAPAPAPVPAQDPGAIIVGLSTVLSGAPTPAPIESGNEPEILPVPVPISVPLGTGLVNAPTGVLPEVTLPTNLIPEPEVIPPGVLPSGSQNLVGTDPVVVVPPAVQTPSLNEPPPQVVPPPAVNIPTTISVLPAPGVTPPSELPGSAILPGTGGGAVVTVPPVSGVLPSPDGGASFPDNRTQSQDSGKNSGALPGKPSLTTPLVIPLETPQSSGVTTVPVGSDPGTQVVLPTSIVVEPQDTPKSTESTATGIPSSMPKVIQPPGGNMKKPANGKLIQIGFKQELNYAFVSSNTSSASQIFQFLPSGVQYGIGNLEVTMQSIQPYDTQKTMGYITALALMYVPEDSVNQLGIDLHTPNSAVYQNPDATVATLMSLVNPAIPLIANTPFGDHEPTATGNGIPSESPGSFSGGSPFGSDAGNTEPVSTSAAAIAAPVAAGTILYGAAMAYVARRYRQKRNARRRASSIGDDPGWMSGAHESHSGSRDSRGSGNTSIRTQQISAPVMAENSLGWN